MLRLIFLAIPTTSAYAAKASGCRLLDVMFPELDRLPQFAANGNIALLRNPIIVNLIDGCALSIPCHRPGDAPVGLMVAGATGTDAKILQAGMAIEAIVAPQPV